MAIGKLLSSLRKKALPLTEAPFCNVDILIDLKRLLLSGCRKVSR